MSIDAKLIVDAMSKLFDELAAGLFKQDAGREASRGVPVPAQSIAVRADPVANNSDEQHHEEPIVADNWGGRDLEFPDASAPEPESCLASTESDALAGVVLAVSSSSSSAPAPAPVARAADEEHTTSTTPTRCSMQVHSSDTTLIASPTSCGSSVGTNMRNAKVSADLLASYDCSIQVPRYISSMSPSLSNGTVLLCVGIGGHEYETVLESMIIQSTILFGLTYVFVKEKWPPPNHFDMQTTQVQLRPIPWPSFAYRTVALKFGNFLMFHGLHLYCKLLVSQHTLQVILVIYALGSQYWLASCTLGIHSDVSDMLLHNSLFISWTDVYSLLLNYHHEPVKWKLIWLPHMCLLHLSSFYFVYNLIWYNGVDNLIWWRPIQLEVQSVDVQVRPIPWPSFSTTHKIIAWWCCYLHMKPP